MKILRTVLFWSHLTAGVAAGAVILVMSLTGAVLALKPQILNWIERDVKYVAVQDQPKLSPQALLMAVKNARPDRRPASVTMNRDPETAATVNLGTAGNVYVDPYTGTILGSGSDRANRFFQSMTTWHRYMGATGESRPLGKSATGAGNLAFLVLAVTGLYIWWPRQLMLRHLWSNAWFRRTATGRARDFNWHNVIGFWCLPAIAIMTASGAVISYPWASSLVYRISGSPVPAVAGRGVGAAGGEAANVSREGGSPGQGRGDVAASASVMPARLDEMWARAERQVPTWSLISMRLPSRDGGAMSFTITDGARWNPFARSTLTLESASTELVTWQPYDASSRGQKARGWLRFAHTGELGGLPGQIVAGVGCLGGVMLTYTGLSLAFRRLWNWSLWSRLRSPGRSPQTGVAPARATTGAQRNASAETAISRPNRDCTSSST